MKSLYGFIKFRQKEINILQEENKSLNDQVNNLHKQILLLIDEVNILKKENISLDENMFLKDELNRLMEDNKSLNHKVSLLTKTIESNPELSQVSKLIRDMEIKRLEASYHDSGGKLASNQNISTNGVDLSVPIKKIKFPPISEK
jgi:hypothetical protein